MKLKDALLRFNNHMPIRIFCGCQTLFNGSKSDVSKQEWDQRVGPYMECNVLNEIVINGRMTFAI